MAYLDWAYQILAKLGGATTSETTNQMTIQQSETKLKFYMHQEKRQLKKSEVNLYLYILICLWFTWNCWIDSVNLQSNSSSFRMQR